MMELAQVAVAQALGTLSWDLPSRVSYTPNTELPFTMVVGNPTTGARSYGLVAQVLVGGQVVWQAAMTVDTAEWFPVPAGGQLTLQGKFQAGQTDLVFRVLLMDQATSTTAAQVQAELVTPGGLDITPLIGVISLMLAFGLVTSMGALMRPEEE